MESAPLIGLALAAFAASAWHYFLNDGSIWWMVNTGILLIGAAINGMDHFDELIADLFSIEWDRGRGGGAEIIILAPIFAFILSPAILVTNLIRAARASKHFRRKRSNHIEF